MTHGLLTGAGLGALLICLSACSDKAPKKDIDAMDRELAAAANGADPALTSALEDQIMVDPALTAQSNDKSARPAAAPRQAPVPPGEGRMRAPATARTPAREAVTLGELARVQASNARTGAKTRGCIKDFQYSAGWANRLPAEFPLYPDARVIEAAGNDGACRMRVVSFSTAASAQQVIGWYQARATRAGFSAEHQATDGEHILAGARDSDDGAYYIILNPRQGGGTEVDLIANNGR